MRMNGISWQEFVARLVAKVPVATVEWSAAAR